MQETASNLHNDVQFLRGVIQRQDRQIKSLQSTVVDMQAKLMKNEIIIIGVEGDLAGEKVNDTAKVFLCNKMKMQLEENKVIFTYRQGFQRGARPRPLVNSESLDFPCSCAAQLAELTEYFFTKICAVMGEGGHLQQRGYAFEKQLLSRLTSSCGYCT